MTKNLCISVLIAGVLISVMGLITLANTSIGMGVKIGYMQLIMAGQSQFGQDEPYLVLNLRDSSFGMEGGLNIPNNLEDFSKDFNPTSYFLKLQFYTPRNHSPFSVFMGAGAVMHSLSAPLEGKFFLLDLPVGIEMSGTEYGFPLTVFASVDFLHFIYTTTTNTAVSQGLENMGGIEFNLGVRLELGLARQQ